MLSLTESNGTKTPRLEGGEEGASKPSDRSRWIAAVGYIFCMCFYSLSRGSNDSFIRAHASQAVLLFIAECAAFLAAAILAATVGKIGIIGLTIIILFQLPVLLAALILSVVGFVKALIGEDWRMPFLGELRDKVPAIHWGKD